MKDWYKYEDVPCIICNCSKTTKIVEKGQFGITTNVVLCHQCGLGFLSPRWDKEAYLDFYKYEYDRLYRSKSMSDDEVLNRYGLPLYNRLKAHIIPDQIVNVLDVGSGNGQLLLSLNSYLPNSKLFAIEPSEESRNVLASNNIQCISDTVDNDWNSQHEKKFDLIIMRHVLEHFSNPLEILLKVKNTLADNGVLYIAVPNGLKPSSNLAGNWFRVVHTYYFNKYSLQNLMSLAKMEIVKIEEGDSSNAHEIYLVAKKGESMSPNFSEEHFKEQLNVYNTQLRREKKISFRLRRVLGKLKSLIKDAFNF